MKFFVVALLVVTTALADKPIKAYLPPGLAKKRPAAPAPPMPFSGKMKAQSLPAGSAVPVSGSSDPTSPNYGTAYKFIASYEGGKTNIGVYIQWNNWPVATPYVVQVSTNLVDWTDAVLSSGDAGRVMVIYDLDQKAFYRIEKAFVSTPVHPTPVP